MFGPSDLFQIHDLEELDDVVQNGLRVQKKGHEPYSVDGRRSPVDLANKSTFLEHD